MNRIHLATCGALALAMVGCASTDKTVPAQAMSPDEAVAGANNLYNEGEKRQSDLLSYKEFTRGTGHLEKARKGLASNYQTDYILKHANEASTYLEQALANSRERTPNATRILQVRRAAIQSGIKDIPDLLAAMTDIDGDLRDATDNFANALDPREFADFQKQYFGLEIRTVQYNELEDTKRSILKASRQDAEDLAPDTLRMALMDVSEAENFIAQSPRDPAVHGPSVSQAIASSVLLSDVMQVIADAPGTPEGIALKIVHQNRELEKQNQELEKMAADVGSLEQNLQSTQSNLSVTQSSLMEKELALEKQNAELASTRSNLQETEGALLMQNQALEKSTTQVRFQRAMDEAVLQFSEEEAAVYQQGTNLIFRLKKINFPSGSASIPETSKPLLAKIDNIIQSVGAEMVAVQGHTDSVGATDTNQKLSTSRAISVANYLSSLAGGYRIGYIGYGESRPIASNDTIDGRAINRRVDLVVTATK